MLDQTDAVRVRLAENEAKNITVKTDGKIVSLTGEVHSKAASDKARWAAWSVPGVTMVESNLSSSN